MVWSECAVYERSLQVVSLHRTVPFPLHRKARCTHQHELIMQKISVIFLTCIVTAIQGQTILIGPSIRNGSFEDGIISPWGGVNGTSQNASFASQGQWYGLLTEVANINAARTDSYQRITANPANGLTFLLTFDIRNGLPGFDFVETSLSSLNSDGSYVSPTATILSSPTLDTAAWGTYQKQFLLPQSWDGSSVRLDIAFYKLSVVSGTTYRGYLDNITLQQIPEPASLILLGMGGSFLFTRLARKSRSKALSQP